MSNNATTNALEYIYDDVCEMGRKEVRRELNQPLSMFFTLFNESLDQLQDRLIEQRFNNLRDMVL